MPDRRGADRRVRADAAGPAAELGPRLRDLRTGRGLTQRALAGDRYTPAYVSSVEAGRRQPSGGALDYFAGRLGVTVDQLRTGQAATGDVQTDLAIAGADARVAADAGAAETTYRGLADRLAADPRRQARCLVALGRLRIADDLGGAVKFFDQALAVLAEEPPHVRADAVCGAAAGVRRGGDPRYAAYLLVSLLDEMRRGGYEDPGALLAVHAELAGCHGDLGDDEQAAASASVALDLAGLTDPAKVADMYLTVARTSLEAGRPGDTAVALHQAWTARRQAMLRPELAFCHQARGRARARAGDLPGAVADLGAGRDLLIACGLVGPAVDVQVELAEAYLALDQPAVAAELLDGAATDQPPGGPRQARAQRVRARLAAHAGDPAGAEQWLRASLDGYRRHGPRHDLAATAGELADLLVAQGRQDQAALLLRAAIAAVDAMGGGRLAGRPGAAWDGAVGRTPERSGSVPPVHLARG